MARYVLILREIEATPSRKLFKYLPGLHEVIFGPKTKIKNDKNKKTMYKNTSYGGPVYFPIDLFKRRALPEGLGQGAGQGPGQARAWARARARASALGRLEPEP